MIYWEKVRFNEKMYDLPKKMYDLPRKYHDLSRKCIIYRENVMIYRKNVWFHDYSYDFSKILFYCIYNFFNVFLIHMYIFFSEMSEIQLIINFGGHWEWSIYQGGDIEIILVDTNLRYGDLFSTVHGMVEADRNRFVYKIRSLLNACEKTVKLKIKKW